MRLLLHSAAWLGLPDDNVNIVGAATVPLISNA
jgi:hypothetical protein